MPIKTNTRVFQTNYYKYFLKSYYYYVIEAGWGSFMYLPLKARVAQVLEQRTNLRWRSCRLRRWYEILLFIC